jgi:hypothetical protein
MDGAQGNDGILRRGTLKDGNAAVGATVSAGFMPAGADLQIGV